MRSFQYIHTDHLDTPRAITDTSGNVVWQWDNSDPFGNNAANQNPNGQGQFQFPLRFAGQYFDSETNTHYNINRDYDPANGGRYIESDPIGLNGGINTYTYVGGNPLSFVDPFGLDKQFTVGINGSIGGNPILPIPGFFLEGGVNIGFTTSGQFILQFQGTLAVGVGVFAGVGIQGGGSTSKCPTPAGMSVQDSLQGDFNFGAGPAIGYSGQYDPIGKSFGGSKGLGKAGVGYGLQVSTGVTQTLTLATPALFSNSDSQSNNTQCGCQ